MDTKKLRQKILDLAIHGKLVPQDPNDEPASVLLERIRAEKEQLIKEGKIKAPKKSKSAGDTSHYPKEVPFEVPEGWVWCSLKDVCHIAGRIGFRGYTKADLVKSDGAITLSPSNIINGETDFSHCTYISWAKYEESPEIMIEIGDIILVKTGSSYGKAALVTMLPKPATINPQFVVLKHIGIDHRFLALVLQSAYARKRYDAFVLGTAIPTFTQEALGNMLIPLPPIEAQRRIADQIENHNQILSSIDSSQRLIEDAILSTKVRILDLAIHGKLVPQNPTDEPAVEILKRINPDFIPSDNLHYEGELPYGWCAINLGQVVDIISGTSYKKSDIVPSGTGIRILRGGNIQKGEILLCDNDVYVQSYLANEKSALHCGDIAIVASTGSHELIGKAAKADVRYTNTQIGAFLRIIRPKMIELTDYLGVIFQSNHYKNYIQEVAKGTNINNIKAAYLTDFIVPIPPYEEQQRILKQIRALFTIIDQISDFVGEAK